MKVLIVDDEIKVCKLLQNLVDWKELGMEIIGVANDGNEALAFILEKHPDIVITDIRMPGCDGIEMIRRVREHDSNVHFVIISGYSQFEYAVSAIRYGVEDYLLKPLKQKDLERILNKISNKNHRLHAAKDERETMLKRMETDAQQIKTHHLREMWNRFTDKTINTTLEQLNQNSRFSFHFDCFALVLIQITTHQSREDTILSNKRVSSILTDELSSIFSEILIAPVDDGILCLINGSKQHFSGIEHILRQIEIRLGNQQTQHGLSEDFVVAYSGVVPNISALHIGIDHVKKAFAQKLLVNDHLIQYTPSQEPSFNVSDFLSPYVRDEFRLIIVSCDYEKLHTFIDSLRKAMADKNVCGYTIILVHQELASLFPSIARSNGIDVPEDYPRCTYQDCRECRTPEELFARLANRISDALENWKSKKGTQTSHLIRKACQYISEHYAEPISLQSVSDYVGLNSSYLSSLFKRETGSTFLDYLTETRIVAARELLVNTDIKIDDLPEKVGYNDFKYFYKRFKKSTGISPKEYRKLYGRY